MQFESTNHSEFNSFEILLTNIQRFCLHDGPGIRTTVFLKGCSLRCPWCCNPENLSSVPQSFVKDGAAGVYGRYITPAELLKEVLKDRVFYEGEINDWKITRADDIYRLPGGVTFSGGECLLQMDKLVPVCCALHEQGVHIAVETCLFVPSKQLRLAIQHIDFFYVDVKILDPVRCEEVEKGNLDQFLSNFEMLMNTGIPVAIRIPVIGGYTDDDMNRKTVKELLEKYKGNILKIELIAEHSLGESKYRSLDMPAPAYVGVSNQLMEQYKDELIEIGISTEICKI